MDYKNPRTTKAELIAELDRRQSIYDNLFELYSKVDANSAEVRNELDVAASRLKEFARKASKTLEGMAEIFAIATLIRVQLQFHFARQHPTMVSLELLTDAIQDGQRMQHYDPVDEREKLFAQSQGAYGGLNPESQREMTQRQATDFQA